MMEISKPQRAERITSKGLRIPPGPPEPYGSTEDLFRWINDNFERYGDIYKASIFGSDVYVVSAPEYAEHILRWNWQNYPRKGQVVKRIALLLGNGLIASNGDFWKRQRRMIQPAFTKSSIASFASIITNVNLELRKEWKLAAEKQVAINVTHSISCMVLKITLMSIFGDDYATVAPEFKILADHSTRNMEFAAAFHALRELICQIARQRRQNGTAAMDFLGRLMQARDREDGNPMPDAQLAREVTTLVVAGHETTAGLLNWMWYLLSRHPEVQNRLDDEFNRLPWSDVPTLDALPNYTYTRQVIDEALRLYPPLWLMTRRSLNDDQLGEFLVPAGTEIYISPYLIQRSPDLWETPDRFDPDRISRDISEDRHELAFCPFGAGPRNCIGESFARVEIQVHLMMLANKLRLNFGERKPPEMTTGMNLLSKDDFIMYPQIKTPVAAC